MGRMVKSVCAVCGEKFSVNNNGTMRVHGPLNDRCEGSGKPPAPNSTTGRPVLETGGKNEKCEEYDKRPDGMYSRTVADKMGKIDLFYCL